MTLEPHEIIDRLDENLFAAIYGGMSRKIRNMFDGLYGKKKKGRLVSLKNRSKNRLEVSRRIQEGLRQPEANQHADEVLRTYFFDRRPLLKAAMDFFEIPNEDGITNVDLTDFEKADSPTLDRLVASLQEGGFEDDDIALYLVFMQAENAQELPITLKFFPESSSGE